MILTDEDPKWDPDETLEEFQARCIPTMANMTGALVSKSPKDAVHCSMEYPAKAGGYAKGAFIGCWVGTV